MAEEEDFSSLPLQDRFAHKVGTYWSCALFEEEDVC